MILCVLIIGKPWLSLAEESEPRHDKTNKMSVPPAKTQISLGWSESSLGTQWVAKDPRFLDVDSEDSDQTGRKSRLICVFAGRTLILLVLSCHGSSVFVCLFSENEKIHAATFSTVTIIFLSLQTYMSYRGSLIRVYTVCHSVNIFRTNYSVIKLYCSNFRVITAIIRVSKFLGFLRYSDKIGH